MTPGDVFTIVRDAYYREYPDGGSFEGFPVVGGKWFASIPERDCRIDLTFIDGKVVIQRHLNSILKGPEKVYEYADPQFLHDVLKAVLRRDRSSIG